MTSSPLNAPDPSLPPVALTAHYAFMARYGRWFNRRLFEAAAGLSDEARRLDRGAFFGSIHGTLNHLMVADKLWLGRFARQAHLPAIEERIWTLPGGFSGLGMALFDDFETMRRHRDEVDEAIEQFAQAVTPPAVSALMRYANTSGLERCHPTWQALSHFFNHQTHHRGQVTTLLMQAGIDPGVTDLIVLSDLS